MNVGAILAESADEGSGGIAGWPDVYIAFSIVHITVDVLVRRPLVGLILCAA
jgi:hypothetical protein